MRLSLLALLEGLLRSGSADWKCAQFIGTAGENDALLLPNLIWRVGRVDSTNRKVALAVARATKIGGFCLKDSTSLASYYLYFANLAPKPRMMACMCVTVILERLRGVFAAQTLSEMYPLLLKRLDDSSDQVRLAHVQHSKAFSVALGENYNSPVGLQLINYLFI